MKKVFCLIFLFCWITTWFIGFNSVLANNQIASIQEALSRWLCYENYWLGADYKGGAIVTIEIKIEGEEFFIRTNDLPAREGYYHFKAFYTGRVKNGRRAIIHSEGYNINLPQIPQGLQNRRYFETGTVFKENVTIPTDCIPHYDQMNSQKELMIRTVASTMQKTLSRWVKMGLKKYPQGITIIIANFNVDYPSTYVLVEPGNELYSVTLHDPQDYDSDEYEREGNYPFGERHIEPGMEDLLSKIRKHGITRKIVLTP